MLLVTALGPAAMLCCTATKFWCCFIAGEMLYLSMLTQASQAASEGSSYLQRFPNLAAPCLWPLYIDHTSQALSLCAISALPKLEKQSYQHSTYQLTHIPGLANVAIEHLIAPGVTALSPGSLAQLPAASPASRDLKFPASSCTDGAGILRRGYHIGEPHVFLLNRGQTGLLGHQACNKNKIHPFIKQKE